MRFLLTTVSEKSHVLCLAPLAWALMNAGHEVRLASAPAMADVIASTGATAVAVGSDHSLHEQLAQEESVENEISDWSSPFVQEQDWETLLVKYHVAVAYALQPYNDTIVDDLVAFARAWRPDVVVWDPVTHAGAVAAAASGARSVRLTWCVDVYSTMRAVFHELAATAPEPADPMADWLAPQVERYGKPFDESLVVGDTTLDLIPGSIQLDLPVDRMPMRFTPYNGPAVAPDWLLEEPSRPRVVLTPGLSFGKILGTSLIPLSASLEALGDLDVEVVATLNEKEREIVGAVPANTRVVDFVPMHALLPSCSAIVHHGGFGTWSTAAGLGVPQYLLPVRMADMWIKGRRTADYGAGICTHPMETTADMLREGVQRLVSEPSYRESAQALRNEIAAMPGACEVADHLAHGR